MQGLTDEEIKFVTEFIATGQKRDSYIKAFDPQGLKPQSISVRAGKLLREDHIQSAIKRFHEKLEKADVIKSIPADIKRDQATDIAALVSMEDHDAELRALRDAAKSEGKWGDAIKAEVKRGELARLYVTTNVNMNQDVPADVSDQPLTPDEWAAEHAEQITH